MSNLRDLLARANASATPARRAESANTVESQFDQLDDFIQATAVTSVPPNFSEGLSKDGQQLQVGDPVTGIFRGQEMSGQVIAVNGDKITVEWKCQEVSTVKASTLTMTNVDDDYEEETMYIEAAQPIQTMGFDKESFVEDTDLESLLRGDSAGSTSFKYGSSINEL